MQERNRAKVLAAARAEFVERGFRDAKIDVIAARAGLTRGAVYSNFPGKRALYFTVLGIYIVLVAAMRADELAGREFFANLPYFLTYTSNWFVGARPGTIFSFSWSLATQEQFYATWPMALAMFPSTWAGGGIAVGSALGLLGDTGWISGRLGFILDRLPFTLLLSAALACAAHVRGSFRWLYPIFGQALSTLAIAVLLGVTLQAEGPVLLQKILAALLILSCALRDDHALARILGWRFLTWAGVRSSSQAIVSALVAAARPFISSTLPLLNNVAGVGAPRFCTSSPTTIAPAVSTRRPSSSSEARTWAGGRRPT